MRGSNGLLALTATVLVLMNGAVANAQRAPAPKESLTRPHETSTATSSLICDSSGKVCVVAGKHGITGSPSTASSHTPVTLSSPSPGAAAELHRSKQQLVTNSRAQLICDLSGKICAPVQAAAPSGVRESTSKVRNTSPTSTKTALMNATPVKSPKVNAEGRQLTESGSLDDAPIDGAGVYEGLTSDDPLDWAVHAYKGQHRLEVYFKGHLYKTYHAVFGRSLEGGAKLWAGDRRTPEGSYLIVGKHRSARFGWFLHLNYPNQRDHERFEQSLAAHLIPASAQEGGQIGIHGTDSPYLNVSEVDWTTGCISVDNVDIRELARLLPVGTLVIINP